MNITRILVLIGVAVWSFNANAFSIPWEGQYMKPGDFLKSGQYLMSKNHAFYAVMQPDGNLSIRKGSGPTDDYGYLWDTERTGPGTQFYAVLQSDGNLAVYRGTNPKDNQGFVWDSHKYESGSGGAYFMTLQDDGNLVVMRGTPGNPKGLLWCALKHGENVSWIPEAKFLHNRSNSKYGYVFYGRNPSALPTSRESIWMADHQYGQKWSFQPDGTLRWAKIKSKCLSINTTHLSLGWQELLLTIGDCNGSALQTGWSYSASDHTIRHKAYPDGCLGSTHDGAGWLFPWFTLHYCRAEDRARWDLE